MKKIEKNLKKYYDMKSVLFILTAILLSIYLYKKDKKSLNEVLNGQQNSSNLTSDKVFSLATEQQIDELEEKMKKMNTDFEAKFIELQQSNEDLRKKNLLLGTILNENFYIIKNRGNLKDLMYLNFDWTINQLPKYIQLPNKEEIEKFLKDNQ